MALNLTPEELIKQRIKSCQEEIMASLKKHNCVLDASITINSREVMPTINVLPLKEPEAKIPMPQDHKVKLDK